MGNSKEILLKALGEIADNNDPSAVDRWIDPNFVQHTADIDDGVEGIRKLVADKSPDDRAELVRVVADGDLVGVHGIWHGWGQSTPLVGFELFRVQNDKIVEHWEGMTAQVSKSASGRSQTDGQAEPDAGADTEKTRALVSEFAQKVLKDADYSVLTDYISTETYWQHNLEAADGLDGFGAAVAKWAEQGKNLVYQTVHKVVAEGDFALLQSEGEFGVPVAYWDLFRVADGKIVEHWDVIAPVPAKVFHTNGVF